MKDEWKEREADSRQKLKETITGPLGSEDAAEKVMQAAFDPYSLQDCLKGDGEDFTVDAGKLIESVMELRLLLASAIVQAESLRKAATH